MKTFVAVVVFGLIILAIIVMVVINFSYKGIKKIKQEAEEKYYRNQRIKEQKEKNPFGEDYFKSADGGSQQRARYAHQTRQSQQPSQKNTTRKTTTSGGVTIIDEREPDKKIFSHDDGEYVEFEEV